jgi:hypothetical protein
VVRVLHGWSANSTGSARPWSRTSPFEEHRIVQALGALRTEAPAAELLGVDPAF